MWPIRYNSRLNFATQRGHSYGFFPSSWTIAIWFTMLVSVENLIRHVGHSFDFFLSWTISMCFIMLILALNLAGQEWQWNSFFFSWTFGSFSSSPLLVKESSMGSFPSWALISCFLTFSLESNLPLYTKLYFDWIWPESCTRVECRFNFLASEEIPLHFLEKGVSKVSFWSHQKFVPI